MKEEGNEPGTRLENEMPCVVLGESASRARD
jgi:hypothetical protein